jgi:hypothetical protein
MIEDFSICHRCTLSCEYLREFSKKIKKALMGYSGAYYWIWIRDICKKYSIKSTRLPFQGFGSDSFYTDPDPAF